MPDMTPDMTPTSLALAVNAPYIRTFLLVITN